MKTFFYSLVVTCLLLATISISKAQLYEGFDDITTLAGDGWVTQNNSVPLGSTSWFQGNSLVFPANSGAPTSYIAANFFNTTGITGTISNWLLTPTLQIKNGDTITFYTQAINQFFPDRLEIRLSTMGASTDVGVGAFDVGDFNMLLLSINPALIANTYPEVWTQYTIVISGISDNPLPGRFAFRYFVTDGGPSGANSNFIGIDDFQFSPLSTIPTMAEWGLIILALLMLQGIWLTLMFKPQNAIIEVPKIWFQGMKQGLQDKRLMLWFAVIAVVAISLLSLASTIQTADFFGLPLALMVVLPAVYIYKSHKRGVQVSA